MIFLYLARPISGCTPEEVKDYYSQWSEYFRSVGYGVLHPMTAKGSLRTDVTYRAYGYDNPVATNHAIVGRDLWMVSKADIVFLYLPNKSMASLGSVAELAVAKWLHKHTVTVIEGEDNIHQHAFVLELSDIVFDNLDAGKEYLVKLAYGEW